MSDKSKRRNQLWSDDDLLRVLARKKEIEEMLAPHMAELRPALDIYASTLTHSQALSEDERARYEANPTQFMADAGDDLFSSLALELASVLVAREVSYESAEAMIPKFIARIEKEAKIFAVHMQPPKGQQH